MVETLERYNRWHVILAQEDLITQAQLNPEDFEQNLGHFTYKGRKVIISHEFKENLVVSIEGNDDDNCKELMDGFSKVVEYQPFCKYTLHLEGKKWPVLPTYEWDMVKPSKRFKELNNNPNVTDLVRIKNKKTKTS